MKIALYCAKTPNGPSVEDQQLLLVRNYLPSPENLYAIYVDNHSNPHRPALRQMLHDLAQNRFQQIAAVHTLHFLLDHTELSQHRATLSLLE